MFAHDRTSLKPGPFYTDAYIAKFFKSTFPNFAYDLIIQTFQFLTIPEFLLLQSLIKDDYISSIKIDQITKKRFIAIDSDCSFGEDKQSVVDDNIIQKENFKILVQAANSIPNNLIPVRFWFLEIFRSKMINESIDCYDNFDIAFQFCDLNYPQYKKLERYRKSSYVTELLIYSIQFIDRKYPNNIDLDFSSYVNLRTFKVNRLTNVRSIKLDSSFETLTDLSTLDKFHEDYLASFINLKNLSLRFQKNLKIKKLPRSIVTLELKPLYEISEIIINSSSDWPEDLRSLSLEISDSSLDQVRNKLPLQLKSLKISYLSTIEKSIPDLPFALNDLELRYSPKVLEDPNLSVFLDPKQIFSSGLETLKIYSLILLNESKNQIHVLHGLQKLTIWIRECLFSLDNIILDKAKSSLKYLVLKIDKYEFEFSSLDFSEFSELTSITLMGCNISSLHHFMLPPCLNNLEFHNNHFALIDHTCPIFSDSWRYPNLHYLTFYSCDIDYISPRINLPINLRTLAIPHYQTKRLLESILRHNSLTYFNLRNSLTSFDMFDDFISTTRKTKSNIHTMDLNLEDRLTQDKAGLDEFYDKIEIVFQKKIVKRVYRWRYLYLTFT
ncbi:hypothetical protein DFJ63DRAFT_36095 [Scheffersomyces coipomensis]|uniref:uncharacterized protein n=1 Tax=Scheffersomyces coipomensis TaxID=1788519 RepID=UPI00315CDD14